MPYSNIKTLILKSVICEPTELALFGYLLEMWTFKPTLDQVVCMQIQI